MGTYIHLLGPLRLTVDGRRCDLGSPKERALFAILALQQPGRLLTSEQLTDRLWDAPPPKAKDTLASYTSRLRGRLQSQAATAPAIVFEDGGYRLAVDPEAIDLTRFRSLKQQADAIAASGEDEAACALYTEAAGLFLGDPLKGVQSRWLDNARDAIHEEYHAARLDRIDGELRLGRHAQSLSELRGLSTAHPLDERLSAQLMTALYRCDRQADALQVFMHTRRALQETVGTEPGERLQELQRLILRHDLSLAVSPRHRASDAQPSDLPQDPPEFVGRLDELAVLTREHDGTTDIVVGMPGIGKTSLVVRAGHLLKEHYPDAQLYLDMGAHGPGQAPMSARHALGTLLHVLGVPLPEIPASVPERARLWRHELAARRVLVILDDPSGPAQVAPLLPAAGTSRVIVAARTDLPGLPGTRHLLLDVLSLDEAVGLFTAISGGESSPLTEEIVRLCGRLPLAIRLTAGHVADGESPADLVESLAIDTDGPDDTPWASIGTTLDLSHRELPPDQRFLFRRLAMHPGPLISVAAAAALTGRPAQALDLPLRALLDQHLLERAGEHGYRLHDLIKAYAAAKAFREDSARERRMALRRLLAYYLYLCDLAERTLRPHRNLPPLPGGLDLPVISEDLDIRRWITAEWANGLAVAHYAIEHEWQREGAHLDFLLAGFLQSAGLWEEAATALDDAFRALRPLGDPSWIARVSLELGLLSFLTGDAEGALVHAERALGHARRAGDPMSAAAALNRIGTAHWSRGRYRQALAHSEEALSLYQDLDAVRGQAEAHNHIGIASWHLGRYGDARRHFRRSLELFDAIGDSRGLAAALNNLGDLLLSQGLHRDAEALYDRAERSLGSTAGLRDVAILASNRGNLDRYRGKHSSALRHYRQALTTYRRTGDRRDMADTLNSIGISYRWLGRHNASVAHHTRAINLAVEIQSPFEKARALLGIGAACHDEGRFPQALKHFEEALAVARESDDVYLEARAHDGAASVILHIEGHEAARIRWRQALDLYRPLRVPEAEVVAIKLHSLTDQVS